MNKFTWRVTRTLLFYIIGLFNTVMIKPEDIGTWKNYAGYLFLVIAVIDTFFIIKILLEKRTGKAGE